jgi:hypothetical protein
MRLTLAALVLGAFSCAGTTPRKPLPVSEAPAPDPSSRFLSPELIGEAPGIAAPEEGTWRAGDAVIYGITLKTPGHSRRWLLRIEVVSPPPAVAGGPAQVLLEVDAFDDGGKAEQSDRVLAPAAELEHGPYPGCLVGSRNPAKVTSEKNSIAIIPSSFTPDESATIDRSIATLRGYFHLATSALKPIVETVVARPSLKEVLLHGGVINLTIGVGMNGRAETEFFMVDGAEMVGGFPEFPEGVCSFPFHVDAYGSPALGGRLFVTDSRPPFLPGGGIVAIEAAHPRDPASTVSVRLLAAKRGPAAAVRK